MSTTVVQSRMPRIGNTFINEATYQVARRDLQRSHSWSFISHQLKVYTSPPAEGVQVPRRARAGLHAAIEVADQRDY